MILFLSFAFLQAPTGIPAADEPVRREYGVAGGPAADEPVRREYETGSRLSKRANVSVWDADKTRKVQADFGQCVVKKHLTVAQHFVLIADLEKSDWRKDVGKIADGHCLVAAAESVDGVEMRFPADTMRYALADALVRREFSGSPLPPVKDAAPLVQPKMDESEYLPKPGQKARKRELQELADNRTKRVAVIFLAHFGECVVRANPVESHKLLMAEPASPEEHTAFTALVPAFSQCLEAGQTLAFNKSTLRGTIAMNYYRLAHAPRATTAVAGASK